MRKVKDAVDLTTNEKIYFKGHAKATYLSDGRNVEEAIENLPTAESSVFEAVYGETTHDEIVAAHNEGKVVICKYNSQVGYLVVLSANNAVFHSYSGVMNWQLTCYANGSWVYSISDTRHELKTLDNGNAQITIAGKTAEVATPQFVENAIRNNHKRRLLIWQRQ